MDMMYLSMVDVAYNLMTKKKKEVDFAKLYQEVSEIKGFTEQEAEDRMSVFYTDITLDGRFITLGENRWDLRERHKFENVHIDMNDVYADLEAEELEEDEEDEDDGLLAEDSYDDE